MPLELQPKQLDGQADPEDLAYSMNTLMGYSWPGNIRELRNAIERAMILTRGPVLHVKLGHKSIQLDAGKAMDGTLGQAERTHIVRALERGAAGASVASTARPDSLASSRRPLSPA
ncbi:AAA-type ATPase lid domain-containing protein [Bradyrhizobium sp. JR3.5]